MSERAPVSLRGPRGRHHGVKGDFELDEQDVGILQRSIQARHVVLAHLAIGPWNDDDRIFTPIIDGDQRHTRRTARTRGNAAHVNPSARNPSRSVRPNTSSPRRPMRRVAAPRRAQV